MSSRRDFLKEFSRNTSGLLLFGSMLPASASLHRPSETPFGKATLLQSKKLGVALVGLGRYSKEQLAPALQQTNYCELVAIVTGTPQKVVEWKKKYNLSDKNIYNYDNFDSIKDNPDIDIVYIVLPTALHAEYTIKAAKAGKHVICEKPMAMTTLECQQMINASKTANKLLSIGYRLHFDVHHLEIMRLAQKKEFGSIKNIQADNCMSQERNTWRTIKKLGGGPLRDAGIYCVQGCIYALGQSPIAVTAVEGKKTDLVKFKEVEESITWKLEFPNGIEANCKTSYAQSQSVLRVEAEKGWYEVSSFGYDGIKGQTSSGKMQVQKNAKKQQAMQMDDFAFCVLNKATSKVPGEMGMHDVKILNAIFDAARTGKRIVLEV